ncbi:MAG: sigma-70 family RNA polymerase sigma factor [Lachnospira sp.]|nr:sigma-70 family RNA polymerase sigma factor [Lachnospira sp.]
MQSFEEIYSEYYPYVYSFCLKMCCDEELAEEITQDTFFKVLKSIDSYRGECKLSVWMCQIAKNIYYNYLKKHKRKADCTPEMMADTLAAPGDFTQDIYNKEMAMQVHQILHTLKEPYKEVFWMKTFGELTFAEIGRVHGKTETWARVTYHRAKMMIKEEVSDVSL